MKVIVSYGGDTIFTLDVRWIENWPTTMKHIRSIVGPFAIVQVVSA